VPKLWQNKQGEVQTLNEQLKEETQTLAKQSKEKGQILVEQVKERAQTIGYQVRYPNSDRAGQRKVTQRLREFERSANFVPGTDKQSNGGNRSNHSRR